MFSGRQAFLLCCLIYSTVCSQQLVVHRFLVCHLVRAGSWTGGDGSWVELSGKMHVLARLLAHLRQRTDDRIVLVSNYTQVIILSVLAESLLTEYHRLKWLILSIIYSNKFPLGFHLFPYTDVTCDVSDTRPFCAIVSWKKIPISEARWNYIDQ